MASRKKSDPTPAAPAAATPTPAPAADTAAADAAKAAAKAAADAKKAADKAEAKAASEAKKVAAKKERDDKAAAKIKEKEDIKKAKDDARAANTRNGITRPGADGLCGQAWAIMDEVSAKKKSPASISEVWEVAKIPTEKNPTGLNEANVRAEYARWRKYYGLSGRIESAKAPEAAAPAK